MKVIATGKSIDHTLKYRDVRFREQEAGRLPNDIFLPTDQTPPLESLKKVRPVMVKQPEMINGEVRVREVSERFQASAPNPAVAGAIGAAVGGIAGAVIGGAITLFTGNSAFLMGGGALGAAAGGFLNANSASNKEVQLVVRQKPILSKTMTGINTRVTQGRLKGRSGYFHSFAAQLETTNHGLYDVPRVQTVRKASS